MPSPSAASATSAQRSALTSLRRIPAMNASPTITGVDAAAPGGHLVALEAAAAGAWPVAGGEHGREVRGAERRRLATAALGGGPPVAGEHAGGPGAGRGRLAGEPRAEAGRGGPTARALADARPRVVELGEVEGEGRVVERAAGEPGVEPVERAGVGPAGVRAERGGGEAARGRRGPLERGGGGGAGRGRILHVNWNYRPSKGRP